MRFYQIIALLFVSFEFYSCNPPPADYAMEWSGRVKKKIIEDASEQPDRTVIDSTNFNSVFYHAKLYKGDKKLKSYSLLPKYSTNGELIAFDTASSTFYSSDQQFELVRELCPVVPQNFEGIKYKGEHVGLAELRYCDGKIKERGFRMNHNVGVWREYDTNGKVIKETDYGNLEMLNKLKEIY